MSSTAQTNPTTSPPEPIPLVLVEGFLGGPGVVLWRDFEVYLNSGGLNRRRTIVASVGPVSSLHDRACELYYALIGGTVDYGESHCNLHQHARFGRKNAEGLYPQWSRERPLHFLGHSMGGPTIVKLQSLIDQGHFGDLAHPHMVLSVSTISAPFRGTQLVYTLGERADAAPSVRPLSFGSILAKGVHLVTFLSPFLPRALDLHAESRSLSYHDISFFSLLKQLWKSDWAESKDATPFDATFQAADEREANFEGETYPRTFYRSHVAYMTQKSDKDNSHTPPVSYLLTPPLYISSRAMGAFDYSILQPVPSFLNVPYSADVSKTAFDAADLERCIPSRPSAILGEEYWANDGVVPLFSQWHPLPCSSTRCQHYESSGLPATSSIEDPKAKAEPGIWHVHQIADAHHMSLLPFWTSTSQQKSFWEDLGCWLRAIDAQMANDE